VYVLKMCLCLIAKPTFGAEDHKNQKQTATLTALLRGGGSTRGGQNTNFEPFELHQHVTIFSYRSYF